MRYTPSTGTVSPASEPSDRSSGDSRADWKSDSSHHANQGFKGNTSSDLSVVASGIPPNHPKPFGTRDGEAPYGTLEASQVSIRSASASEINPPSDSSLRRRHKRALFIQRYGPNGTMMQRGPGFKRPDEKSGLFFGNRQGSMDHDPSTATYAQDETTAITDQPVMTAPPAKPYIGNYSRTPVAPFTAIPDSQNTSPEPQFLCVPSRPPSDFYKEPKPFCETRQTRPSSNCGTQAESIRPSWYAPGTALLSKAAKSCYTASLNKYNQAARWYERGLALTGFRETAVQSALGSHFREMSRTETASGAIWSTVKAHSVRPGPRQSWTQFTRKKTTGMASSSRRHDGDD